MSVLPNKHLVSDAVCIYACYTFAVYLALLSLEVVLYVVVITLWTMCYPLHVAHFCCIDSHYSLQEENLWYLRVKTARHIFPLSDLTAIYPGEPG